MSSWYGRCFPFNFSGQSAYRKQSGGYETLICMMIMIFIIVIPKDHKCGEYCYPESGMP